MLPDPHQDGVIKILQWNGDNSILIHRLFNDDLCALALD
jgi:hypothetical protein